MRPHDLVLVVGARRVGLRVRRCVGLGPAHQRVFLDHLLVRIEHQELASVEFGGPEAVLAVDLAAARTGHGGRRLVLGIFDRPWIEEADLAFLPDVKMGPALGVGVGVVDAPVLGDLEDRPLQLFAA